jgi:hypothetical protein
VRRRSRKQSRPIVAMMVGLELVVKPNV